MIEAVKMKIFIISLIILLFSEITFDVHVSLSEISADSYCQLTISLIQQQISNYQELAALAKERGNNRTAFNNFEKAKKTKFKQADESLFSSFGITAAEYVMYMSKHSRSVNAYLNAHPEIKEQIEELVTQRNTLLEQYESLKKPDGVMKTK